MMDRLTGLRHSLRLRLVFISVSVFLTVLALFAWQLSYMFEQHVERRIFRELDNHLGQLITLLRKNDKGRIVLSRPLSDPRFSQPYSGLYWQINDETGVRGRSRSLWDYALDVKPDMPGRGLVHEYTLKGPEGGPLYAVVRAVWLDLGDGEKRYVITVAQDHREISAAVAEFSSDLIWGIVMLLAVLLLALAVQVWLGLRPLDHLRRQVAEIRAGRRERLGEGTISELQPLIEEINALLAAQARNMQRARSRASDLAHGMKTPLSILAAQSRKLSRMGLRDVAQEIHRQVQALRQHVERELARAKIHGLRTGRPRTTRARPQIEAIVQALAPLRAEDPVEWHLDIAPDATVPMERGDFLEIAGNILENACKWARRHVRVRVETDAAGRVHLVVEDDGPGVPESQHAEIFKRGKRLDESVQGTGLGMAIVHDVIDSYGYGIAFHRSPLGGLGVRVTFAAGGFRPSPADREDQAAGASSS
jgi:signal transduction histidine kinase